VSSIFRRAKSAPINLVSTSTGSATAISVIFPELKDQLDGLAVCIPLLHASPIDCALADLTIVLALVSGFGPDLTQIIGLALFGTFFAVNSAIHS
jgi:hypothetical protein